MVQDDVFMILVHVSLIPSYSSISMLNMEHTWTMQLKGPGHSNKYHFTRLELKEFFLLIFKDYWVM